MPPRHYKYLTLSFALATSSVSAINIHKNQPQTTHYFLYSGAAPQTTAGYEDFQNYIPCNQATFNDCPNGNVVECAVAVNAVIYSDGNQYPDFTDMLFTSSGFPINGPTLVGNRTKL